MAVEHDHRAHHRLGHGVDEPSSKDEPIGGGQVETVERDAVFGGRFVVVNVSTKRTDEQMRQENLRREP